MRFRGGIVFAIKDVVADRTRRVTIDAIRYHALNVRHGGLRQQTMSSRPPNLRTLCRSGVRRWYSARGSSINKVPVMASAGQPSSRLATCLAFFVPGVGFGVWAPLVPFAKDRLAVDDGVLGLLLLCLGAGSIIAMLLTGVLSARYGVRLIILVGGLSLAIVLPCLTIASKLALGVALFALGASIGSISVAANIHAIEVERTAECPLMSSFHAQFSIGGLVGSAAMTAFLSLQIDAFVSTVVCSGLIVIAIMLAWPRLVPTAQADQGPSFVLPRSIVLLLAAIAAIAFLIEGAMLDWAALLVVGAGLAPKTQSGLAYVLFSIAMTVGRLAGDAVVERAGDRATLMFGSLLALAGFGALLAAPVAVIAMAGLLLIGLGLSNVAPILFRRAGTQEAMPVGPAIAAIMTVGYAGILIGPAGMGLLAKYVGLPAAFGVLAGLMCLVVLLAPIVTANTR